jgi:uroporphyrinogen III methyltransferase/synthase
LTLKGAQALAQADALVYDALVNEVLLALAPPSARRFHVGKRGGLHAVQQDKINQLLLRLARSGRRVVRLKGGDPFLFGRGGEEAEFLARHRIRFEIVPGVSSVSAVPAYAGIPLTDRRYTSMVTIVTGRGGGESVHEGPGVDWSQISQKGTLVILMGMSTLTQITDALMRHGWKHNTPAAVIQWGTLAFQRTVTGQLSDIVHRARQAGLSAPAIVIIGDVTRLRNKIKWFEKKPLFGKTIVVTRAVGQAGRLTQLLEESGAHVMEIPAIRMAPPASYRFLDHAIRHLAEFDWLIFTSANGVDAFAQRLKKLRRHLPLPLLTCAVGPSTAEAMHRESIPVTCMPKKYEGVEIARTLEDVKGKKILIARAQEAPDDLPRMLQKRGALVTIAPAYKTIPGADRAQARKIRHAPVDCVIFTSGSSVRGFLSAFRPPERKKIFSRAVAASIGPVTSRKLRAMGIRPKIEARPSTIPALVNALRVHFSRKTRGDLNG